MFSISFSRVFTNEGGYQSDPQDRGNWTSGVVGKGSLKGTKFGLAAMTYPKLDIINITVEQAKEIYRRDWWHKLHMNTYPYALQYQLFDAAINHGMHNATKMLQRAVGAEADGIIGPKTRSAITRCDINDLLMCFLAERLSFMTDVKTWNVYGKGWARRIAHNLKIASTDN